MNDYKGKSDRDEEHVPDNNEIMSRRARAMSGLYGAISEQAGRLRHLSNRRRRETAIDDRGISLSEEDKDLTEAIARLAEAFESADVYGRAAVASAGAKTGSGPVGVSNLVNGSRPLGCGAG